MRPPLLYYMESWLLIFINKYCILMGVLTQYYIYDISYLYLNMIILYIATSEWFKHT